MSATTTRLRHLPRLAQPSFLSKERSIAAPGFNRWLVPPAALAIHLCIGMAYGFSVFWLPLSRAVGITQPIACGPEVGFLQELFVTTCDWRVSTLGWLFTLFFVFLGMSAALFGPWLERAGPRMAGVVSAILWCGGLLISAVGIQAHQFWLILLGSGAIGGIGLGLGYTSPVSTLIKWFPDRRGMLPSSPTSRRSAARALHGKAPATPSACATTSSRVTHE
jgi:MFS family permease